jgi:D-alanyl-D-alanine carboxypeptidase (penicillin-binding protein 5/6)
MFAKVKSRIALADLIQGAVVQSANDACIVIAEGMAGSEAAFAERMTERARTLGLARSTFRNATGLPAEGQVVTARELVDLARHIWRTYPEFYGTYAQPDFTWNNITQRNRNPLLAMDIGADGLGTGYTEASGFSIVGSAAQGGTRLFLAMSGMQSEQERAREARRLLEWGRDSFQRMRFLEPDEIVGQAQVFGGARPAVDLVAHQPVAIFVPKGDAGAVSARIVYDGPLPAPVREGDEVGTLEVLVSGTTSVRAPLYAAETIERGSIHRRAFDAVLELVGGWMRLALPA